MTFSKYLTIFFLALIIVLAMRGDLSYFFPVIANYFRSLEYYLGTAYNQYYGYKPPVNPDPSVHPLFDNSMNFTGSLSLIGMLLLTIGIAYAIFRR